MSELGEQPSAAHADAISKFLNTQKEQQRYTSELLQTNQTTYKGVPITLADSYRNSTTQTQLEASSSLLLGLIDERIPLLAIFPGLHVAFENKPVAVKLNKKWKKVLPEMSYSFLTKTITISETSPIGDGVWDHEFGHHIHASFTQEDNEKLLMKHGWSIEEKDGTTRRATVADLVAIMGDEMDADQTIIDIENGAYVPKWEYIHPDGVKRKGYRYSNPKEMVAEIVADNTEDILNLIEEKNLNTPDQQRPIIEYLLGEL